MSLKHGNSLLVYGAKVVYAWPSLDPIMAGALCTILPILWLSCMYELHSWLQLPENKSLLVLTDSCYLFNWDFSRNCCFQQVSSAILEELQSMKTLFVKRRLVGVWQILRNPSCILSDNIVMLQQELLILPFVYFLVFMFYFILISFTSVSFSGCSTYFSASSTSNNTLVWDTRFLSMNRGKVSLDASCQSNDLLFFRPLHCLCHGKQMPTAKHSGQQLPGWVSNNRLCCILFIQLNFYPFKKDWWYQPFCKLKRIYIHAMDSN